MSQDDRELMCRIQQGEEELFSLLAEKYRSRLYRFAYSKMGRTSTAEDVVQETLLAAFSARTTYRSEFAFSTWLWTILLNLCRTTARKQARHPVESLEPLRNSVVDRSEPSGGLEQLLRQEQSEELRSKLTELPEAQSDAIRLRFFAELTYDEIATTMNSSLSGAKKRVRCGLETLANMWNHQEQDR